MIRRIKHYIHNPRFIKIWMLSHIAPFIKDDVKFIKMKWKLHMDYPLNLDNPKTFNEKLQWLKLYNRRPEYTAMVDKYAVKEYVSKIIGSQYVIPTLGVWESPDEIDWERLPARFVLKTTHGGGNAGVVICKDKNTFDKQNAIKRLEKSLKQDISTSLREWPYKNVPRRIIAEKYLEDSANNGDLPDYKFFCFDGEVKALFVGTERGTGDVKFDFFDAEFNHLDLVQKHPMSGRMIPKPQNFDLMKKLASKLSRGIPHVRIDLYEANGEVFFGEMTFFHHGGIVPFHPEKWDYEFGSWVKLPNKNK